ncbi:MAG: hypothetical protein HPY76_07410 [Anaerolineae bacterium]|nr:hypothetical protein [Anaerolineae bacterium]
MISQPPGGISAVPGAWNSVQVPAFLCNTTLGWQKALLPAQPNRCLAGSEIASSLVPAALLARHIIR